MKKVQAVLEELMRQNHTLGRAGVFKELAALAIKWVSMTEEEKNKVYYKNACHEFNFFLFKKDPGYFSKIVKPLIEYKMEKTFVDFYLLGQYQHLVSIFNSLESK
jgi:Fe2+ or Zn2+ uptake regulation protein